MARLASTRLRALQPFWRPRRRPKLPGKASEKSLTTHTARSVATQSTILTAHTKSLRSPQSQNANTTHIQSLPLGRRRLERLHEELHALLLLLIALCRVERHEILQRRNRVRVHVAKQLALQFARAFK